MLERFRDGRSLSPIRQAEAYWTALREPGDVPFRTQIDPRGLGNILEHAFVLERVAPGIARFRLAGQHLTELAGMEVRGMPLTAFFTPSARGRIGELLTRVFDTPSVVDLTLTGEPRRGRPRSEARMILLPLKSDAGDIDRALGVLVTDRGSDSIPRRFDVTGAEFRTIGEVKTSPAREEPPVPGFAEAQSPVGGMIPRLRLVK